MTDQTAPLPTGLAADAEPAKRTELAPEAQRALAEAVERRKAADAVAADAAKAAEVGGRVGPDPVRYGDWETGGIVSDF